MASTKKMEKIIGARAGMPLARAERLAAKTGARSGASPRFYATLGFMSVVGLAGYGVLMGTGSTAAAPDMVIAAVQAEAVVVQDTAAVAVVADQAGETEILPEATRKASVEVASAALAPSKGEMIPSAVPAATIAVSATCVDEIEGLVVGLQTAAATDERWSAQQAGVTRLVQAAVDCDVAKFRVAGSLELAGSGLADLKVRWDRDDKVLDLAMIDRLAGPAGQDPAHPDDQSIEFVIR